MLLNQYVLLEYHLGIWGIVCGSYIPLEQLDSYYIKSPCRGNSVLEILSGKKFFFSIMPWSLVARTTAYRTFWVRTLLNSCNIDTIDWWCSLGWRKESHFIKIQFVKDNTSPWLAAIWNPLQVPKCSFLMWLALKNRLLTKDRKVVFGQNVNTTWEWPV